MLLYVIKILFEGKKTLQNNTKYSFNIKNTLNDWSVKVEILTGLGKVANGLSCQVTSTIPRT